MDHFFNLRLGTKYGVDSALFVSNLRYWTVRNFANIKHIHDGLCWSYNTLEALGEIFPYWSKKQLERVINNCVKDGLVVKGNYNATTYDRTCWYALAPKAYWFFPELVTEKNLDLLYLSISPNGEMEFPEWRNRFPQMETPIPDNIPYTKPNINNKGTSDEALLAHITENPTSGETLNDDKNSEKIFEDDDGNLTSNAVSKIQDRNLEELDWINNQALDVLEAKKGLDESESYTKSDYRKNRTLNCTDQLKLTQYDINNILSSNIFQIPEQIIHDWIANRKKKRAAVTKTAWNKINKELAKCKEQGIDPIDAFETMVASGWQSLKVEYFENKKKSQVSQWDVDSVMRA